MKNARPFTALFAIALLSMSATTVNATEGVSPGALDRLAVVDQRCPTFSWQDDHTATLYEIVAYSLHTDESPAAAELAAEAEVLYSQVPAGATSWTPSAEQCFAPGGRYVWFVRPVMELIDDQVIEAGEWSAGRYFTVPAGPSSEDVARAVETLRRWEAANGGGPLSLSSASDPDAAPATATATDSGTGSNHRKSVPTASAAIRGEHPDTTGEVYGLVGTSASVDGAGIAAANMTGGPDLVLDGSADGSTDTRISQGGIDRTSGVDETFSIGNSGHGGITLDVEGELAADSLDCPGCVGTVEIADGSVRAGDLGPNSVNETHLADEAVTSAHIALGAVTSSKIGAGAVDTAQLRAGAATSAIIEDGSIVDADLAIDAVSKNKIQDDAVVGAKILDGSITAADLSADSVGSAEIIDGSVTSDDLSIGVIGAGQIAADSIGSAEIIDGSITSVDIGSSEVNSTHILNMSVNTAELSPNAVTSSKIEDGTIATEDLAIGAVTMTKIQDQAVRSSKIGPLAVTSSKLADGAVTAQKVAPGEIQLRVGTECPAGSSIRSIDQTGAVICEPDDGADLIPPIQIVGSEDSVPILTAANSGTSSALLGDSSGDNGVGVNGAASGYNGIALYGEATGESSTGVKGLGFSQGGYFASSGLSAGIGIVAKGGTNGLAAVFIGNVSIKDRDTGDLQIELGKGLDYAEGFDVSDGEVLEAGTVLIIDPETPGELMRSIRAYDTRVAGIVAGANGLGSGVRLGAEGFDHDVALAGRVYCNVDATEAGIRPGDLLTTSSTPGHAMKATDGDRAHGAILGKAMEPLEVGRTGQVLVLVGLQ